MRCSRLRASLRQRPLPKHVAEGLAWMLMLLADDLGSEATPSDCRPARLTRSYLKIFDGSVPHAQSRRAAQGKQTS